MKLGWQGQEGRKVMSQVKWTPPYNGAKHSSTCQTIKKAKKVHVIVISSIRCTGIQFTRRTHIGPSSYFGLLRTLRYGHYGLRATKMRAEDLIRGLVSAFAH